MIVTTNVSPGTSSDTAGGSDQIVDLEIIDGSHAGSKYLTKKVRASSSCAVEVTAQVDDLLRLGVQNIKAETRMAITTHESADVGVCITNRLSPGKWSFSHASPSRRCFGCSKTCSVLQQQEREAEITSVS